jgi:hypothetical protein
MSFRKKTPAVLGKARMRISSVKTVSQTLQITQGITVVEFEGKVDLLSSSVDKYNGLLGEVDELSNNIDVLVKEVRDLNERLLLSVGSYYGKDSNEYEKAGGVRKSDRKKTVRKEKIIAT